MFFQEPDDYANIRQATQAAMDEHDPLPQDALDRLAEYGIQTSEDAEGAEIRRLVLEIEELVIQTRWHLGQAMLIWRAYPQLWTPTDGDRLLAEHGIATGAQLLLRHYRRDTSRLFYANAAERAANGGTAGGWALHMLVDNTIYRSLAVLDRVAGLLCIASGVRFNNGKAYFRSKKMQVIRDAVGPELGDPLVELADSEGLVFLTDYRDGVAHTRRPTSWVSGIPAVDAWFGPDAVLELTDTVDWGADELIAIGLMAYDVACRGLRAAVPICERTTRSDVA